MKRLVQSLAVVVFAGAAVLAMAAPSKEEVSAAVNAGDYQKAEQLMGQVLAEKPKSASAHFVMAELDAKMGKISQARSELAVAEALADGKPFANPAAVSGLKAEIEKRSHEGSGYKTVSTNSGSHSSGSSWLSWLFIIVAILVVVAVVKSLMRPKFQPVNGGNYIGQGGQGYGGQGYGGGQPYGGYPPAGGGMGSSIVGGLATGAAIGAGVVAGEVLMHKMLDDDHPQAAPQNTNWQDSQQYVDNTVDNSYDTGGSDLGVGGGGWDDGGGFGGGDDWS